LDTNLPNQLLRVSVDAEQPYFVEISGGKHRCTIRFMQPSPNGQRPIQATQDVPFTLMRCVF
ncbi:MAG: cell division protein ZapD, partial [Methylococcales bacterium]|nr:cell division protein ZapD [Methylococcales bacterium]